MQELIIKIFEVAIITSLICLAELYLPCIESTVHSIRYFDGQKLGFFFFWLMLCNIALLSMLAVVMYLYFQVKGFFLIHVYLIVYKLLLVSLAHFTLSVYLII